MPEPNFLPLCLNEFKKLRTAIDSAISQIKPEDFHRRLDPGSNTIAELMKHLAGNTRSRCKDFLTSDGEKPDRNRDEEFLTSDADTPERIRQTLDDAWEILFFEYGRLTEADLEKSVLIRSEPHLVRQAILRQLTHHSGHVGQIVFLAKHFVGDSWKTLSVPRGQSREYERVMRSKFGSK